MSIKEDLKQLKDYCYNYIEREYGKRQNYIRRTRITKNGLFIYGHKVYAPGYSLYYDIYTFGDAQLYFSYQRLDSTLDNIYDNIHNALRRNIMAKGDRISFTLTCRRQ